MAALKEKAEPIFLDDAAKPSLLEKAKKRKKQIAIAIVVTAFIVLSIVYFVKRK